MGTGSRAPPPPGCVSPHLTGPPTPPLLVCTSPAVRPFSSPSFLYENKHHFWLVTPAAACSACRGGHPFFFWGGVRMGLWGAAGHLLLAEDTGCTAGMSPAPSWSPPHPRVLGKGRWETAPAGCRAPNRLSIFINMQMSGGDGSPPPAAVNYLMWRRWRCAPLAAHAGLRLRHPPGAAPPKPPTPGAPCALGTPGDPSHPQGTLAPPGPPQTILF